MRRVFQVVLSVLFVLGAGLVFGQDAGASPAAGVTFNWGLVFAAAGIMFATFMGGVGSAWGLGLSGQAASGALSEDPNKFGVIFPIQAMPGTQGIYGLLIGFLIFVKVSNPAITFTLEKGVFTLLSAFPIAVSGLVTGYWQGVAAAAAIQLVSRKPGEFGKAIISPALVETYAVFGLLMSFMMWLQI